MCSDNSKTGFKQKRKTFLFWASLIFWISSLIISILYLEVNPISPTCSTELPKNSLQNPCDYRDTTYGQTIASFVFFSGFFTWIIPVLIKSHKL
jgi:hypothetical protein